MNGQMGTRIRGWSVALAVGLAFGSGGAQAGTIVKANNTDNLNLGSSWVGGVVPGSGDIGLWDSTVAANTVSLGADLGWLGMGIDGTHTGNVTINGVNTLTVGAAGINPLPNITFTINAAIALGVSQTWTTGGSGTFIPAGAVDTAGYTLTLDGGATKQFKGTITGGGAIFIRDGTLKMTNPGAVATSSTVTVYLNATIAYDTAAGVAAVPRTAAVTLQGGTLTVGGQASANTVETNANALTIGAGAAAVTITPNVAKNAQLYSGSLVRNTGGTVLLRGTSLGVNTLASLTANSANLALGLAPMLVGGGGGAGSTTVSIVPGAYGDSTAGGNGTAWVTYDSTYGVRLLSTTTEYTNVITSGQSQLDNARYVNTSGSGVVVTTLSQDTTVNSLAFELTGAGTNTGVRIDGDTPGRQLTLHSGMIFARQSVTTAVASDAMIISTNLTLNLNGQEGIFVCSANGISQGNTPAPLYISANITNDAGKGVTVGAIGGANGEVYFNGPVTNTYTGPTVLNSGYLRLSRGTGYANIGIPGNLVVNGGALLKSSESIPDTADVTLNGGSFYFDNTTSSGNNGHQETIRNLTMGGGAISYNSGTEHRFYINGDARINVGDLRLNAGGDVTVLGSTILNGGRVLVSYSSGTNVTSALFTLNHLIISNLTNGAYSAVVLRSHATNKGGLLTLTGTVTVVGNGVNTNSVVFDSENSALANQGAIALSGARTFDISDGAADVDLAIMPSISLINGATVGGLTKTGAGTLALVGTNTYNGGTTISNGTLILSGSLASPVAVCTGAVLTGTGTIATNGATALTVEAGGIVNAGSVDGIGTLTVTGNVFFATGAEWVLEAGDASADALLVSGDVTAESNPVRVTVTTTSAPPWRVMVADHIVPDFRTSVSGLTLTKRNGNTELWLSAGGPGTMIMIR